MNIQYGRDDVDYETYYSAWMKQLAKQYTVAELENRLYGAKRNVKKAAISHLRAIEKTTSMQSNSQARAQRGNVVSAAGDYAAALRGALEIYELFPEQTKGECNDEST